MLTHASFCVVRCAAYMVYVCACVYARGSVHAAAWQFQVVLVDTFRDAPDYFWGVLQCFKKKAQLPPTISAEPIGPGAFLFFL